MKRTIKHASIFFLLIVNALAAQRAGDTWHDSNTDSEHHYQSEDKSYTDRYQERKHRYRNEREASQSDAQHPRFWVVEKDWVKCNSVENYENTIKQLISQLKRSNHQGVFPWFAFVDPEKCLYTHIVPLHEIGDLAHLYEAWSRFTDRSQAAPLFANFEGDVNAWSTFIMETVMELSYRPPDNREKDDQEDYFMIELVHVTPGQETLFEDILKKWVSGFREYNRGKGAPSGWNTYRVLIGEKLPAYIIVSSAKSMEDFKKHMSISLQVGERDKLFSGASFGVVTDYAWSIDQYLPELSFFPMDDKTMD